MGCDFDSVSMVSITVVPLSYSITLLTEIYSYYLVKLFLA